MTHTEDEMPFKGNQYLVADFTNSAHREDYKELNANPVEKIEEANLVCSVVKRPYEGLQVGESKSPGFVQPLQYGDGHQYRHRLVLDIDLPITVVPSTTPGHSHLYIDKEMSWHHALNILYALAAAGIVEEGYARACENDGFTTVRLPWEKKLTEREEVADYEDELAEKLGF